MRREIEGPNGEKSVVNALEKLPDQEERIGSKREVEQIG